jgi:signal transduction histidine kinase
MYRFLYALAVLLWFGLTFILNDMATRSGMSLITVQFTSPVAFAWVMLAVGLLLIGILNITRTRSRGARWIDRYQALSTYLNEGVVVCSPRGAIHWHNEAGKILLNGGVLNPNLSGLLKRAHDSQRMAIQTLAVGDGQRYSVQTLPLDRQTYALISRPLQSAGGQNTFYENFIRRVVHDMRNPLAAIIGHAANMQQSNVMESQQWRKSATTIEEEARRLTRLVDSLLFDARLAYVPLELKMLDLADVLEEAIYAQDERAQQEGKQLEMDAPPGPMRLEADRDLLARAFENLIDNSLKYSGHDGHLHIHLETQPTAYVIQFADNGEGIPPEYLPDRIFEPLVRARAHGSGSGLGLSTVRKIVEMHGGTIIAQSRVGAGTTMTVRLPRPGGNDG